MLTQSTGLLMDIGAVMPTSSGVVTAVSASLIEHAGPALELAVVERNYGRSLSESA